MTSQRWVPNPDAMDEDPPLRAQAVISNFRRIGGLMRRRIPQRLSDDIGGHV